MKKVFTILAALFIASFAIKALAAPLPPCPLITDGTTETIFTIDTLDPSQAVSACKEDQAADCSLSAVLAGINTVFPIQCTSNQLSKAIIKIRFSQSADFPDTIEMDNGYIFMLTPPSSLKKIIIDGSLYAEKKFKFMGASDSTKSLFEVKCVEADCPGVPDFTDIEFKNLEFENGMFGLYFAYGNSKKGNLSISNVSLKENKLYNLYIENSKEVEVVIDKLHAENLSPLLASLAFNGLDMVSGILSNSSITIPNTSVSDAIAFMGSGSKLHKFQISGSNISAYRNIRFLSSTQLNNDILIQDSTLNFKMAGLSSEGPLSGLSIKNTSFVGNNTTGSKAIYISRSSATDGAMDVEIFTDPAIPKKMEIKKADYGIYVKGAVQVFGINGVEMSHLKTGIFLENSNSIEPTYVGYKKITFKDVATPVQFKSSFGDNIYSDDILTAKATNLGIDTPPLTGQSIKLFRDEAKPNWLKIQVKYFEGCEQNVSPDTLIDAYWKKTSSLLLPISINSNTGKKESCENGYCDYSVETQFDATHVPTYNGEDLDGLEIVVNMTCMGVLSSMLSDSVSILSADWIGQETITVDTIADSTPGDLNTKKCKDEVVGDCSLRGAIEYAKAKRDEGKTHVIKIVFKQDIGTDMVLASPLNINANKLYIDGAVLVPASDLAKMKISTMGNFQGAQLVEISKGEVSMSNTALDVHNKADRIVLISYSNVLGSSVLNDIEFYNSKTAIDVVHQAFVLVSSPIFTDITEKGINIQDQNAIVRIIGASAKGNIMPSNLVFGSSSKTPTISQYIPINVGLPIKIPIQASYAGDLPSYVQVYVGFSNKPDWKLEYIGIYTPTKLEGQNKFFIEAELSLLEYQPSTLLNWGEMAVYIVDDVKTGSWFTSSNFSSKTIITADFSKWDSDSDTIMDYLDNAPQNSNPDQKDTDSDTIPDVLDSDDDQDTVDDAVDNCPMIDNQTQVNTDGDGFGDLCDDDDDNDGFADSVDNCPYNYNPDPKTYLDVICIADLDKDGVRDDQDNCVGLANADQADYDFDAKGDACDTDKDNDGVENSADNCPMVANPDQMDTDGDKTGDACDSTPVPPQPTPGTPEPTPDPSPSPSPTPTPEASEDSGGCSLILR